MATPADLRSETQARQSVLRQLIREGTESTQEGLCEALRKKDFDVTQSTVSRDLRRIGAIKANNAEGEVIYRLPEDHQAMSPYIGHTLDGLLTNIEFNESLVVLHTTPGSASLVARHLDNIRSSIGVLGTIAGDDTIFVAPLSQKKIPSLIKKIREEFL